MLHQVIIKVLQRTQKITHTVNMADSNDKGYTQFFFFLLIISLRKDKELSHLLANERSQVRTAELLVQSPLVPRPRCQARFPDSYLPAWFLELALYIAKSTALQALSKYSQANTAEAFYKSIIEPTLCKYDLERDTLSQAAHQALARLWSPLHIALSRGDTP